MSEIVPNNIVEVNNNRIISPDSEPPTDLDFIIRVDTSNSGTSGVDQFTLPLFLGETYNFTWETSDGTSGAHNTDADLTFTFPSGSGIYDINILGTLPRVYFNNSGDRQKITEISAWGSINWAASQDFAYYGCSNLTITATDSPNFSGVSSMESTFRACTSFLSFPSSVNLYSVSNFTNTWLDCTAMTSFSPTNLSSASLLISTWENCAFETWTLLNFPSLIDATGAWRNNNLATFPVLVLGVGAIVNWTNTWRDNALMITFPAQDFKLSEVFVNTWQNCDLLEEMADHTWAPITLEGAYQNSFALATLPDNLNTSRLESLKMTFRVCTGLTYLPAWDVSNVLNLNEMCENANGNPITFTYMRFYDFGSSTDCDKIFKAVNMPFHDYSAALIQTNRSGTSNVLFGSDLNKYNSQGETAKNLMLGRGWTFTDSLLESPDQFTILLNGDGSIQQDPITGQVLFTTP